MREPCSPSADSSNGSGGLGALGENAQRLLKPATSMARIASGYLRDIRRGMGQGEEYLEGQGVFGMSQTSGDRCLGRTYSTGGRKLERVLAMRKLPALAALGVSL